MTRARTVDVVTAGTSGDRVLVVKGTGGMGNRMLAAATGILYARLSGRRLVVDWRDPTYSSDGSNVFHRFFRAPACDVSDRVPETDDVVPSAWRGRLHESVLQVIARVQGKREIDPTRDIDPARERQSLLGVRRIDYPERVAVFWSYFAPLYRLRPHLADREPELAALSDAELLRRLFSDELVLQPEIRERVRAFRAAHLHGATVGVHVRYSDYRVPLRKILATLADLLRREPALQVFLATDNAEVLRTVQRLYPDVVTTPHWYGAVGSPLHDHPACPDPTAGGIEALVDMYVLAECDYLIVDTSSSFAAVAVMLTPRAPNTVFNVKRRGYKLPRFRLRIRTILWTRARLFSAVPRLLGRFLSRAAR